MPFVIKLKMKYKILLNINKVIDHNLVKTMSE